MALLKKQTILIAMDDSEDSESAFDSLVTNTDAILSLVESEKAKRSANLRKYQSKLRDALLVGKVVTSCQSSPGQVIINTSIQHDASVIILGSRSHDAGIHPVDSVCKYVVAHSRIPVIVCKSPKTCDLLPDIKDEFAEENQAVNSTSAKSSRSRIRRPHQNSGSTNDLQPGSGINGTGTKEDMSIKNSNIRDNKTLLENEDSESNVSSQTETTNNNEATTSLLDNSHVDLQTESISYKSIKGDLQPDESTAGFLNNTQVDLQTEKIVNNKSTADLLDESQGNLQTTDYGKCTMELMNNTQEEQQTEVTDQHGSTADLPYNSQSDLQSNTTENGESSNAVVDIGQVVQTKTTGSDMVPGEMS